MRLDVDDRPIDAADGRYGRVSYDAVTGKASGAFANRALEDLLELEPREAEERYAWIRESRVRKRGTRIRQSSREGAG